MMTICRPVGSETTEEQSWPVLVCVLGHFRLVAAGRPVPMRAGGKTQALLSMLALGPANGVSRDTMLATVWPDSEPSQAAQSLNSLVHHLQRLLSDGLGGAPFLVRVGGAYRLNFDAGVAVDAVKFVALAAEGERHVATGETVAAMERFGRAVALYHGDLDEATSVQAVVERERLRGIYLGLLGQLADHHFMAGDHAAAQRYAQCALASEPCREDFHRLLMRSFVRAGERARALRQYRLCEQVLMSEFQALPEMATRALFEQVRDDPEHA